MATKNPRISFIPTDRTLATLRQINALSGRSMASVVTELMDETCPILEEMIVALRKVNDQPAKVREFMDELAKFARSEISAAVDSVNEELPLPMPDKRRAHQKPGARRAGTG